MPRRPRRSGSYSHTPLTKLTPPPTKLTPPTTTPTKRTVLHSRSTMMPTLMSLRALDRRGPRLVHAPASTLIRPALPQQVHLALHSTRQLVPVGVSFAPPLRTHTISRRRLRSVNTHIPPSDRPPSPSLCMVPGRSLGLRTPVRVPLEAFPCSRDDSHHSSRRGGAYRLTPPQRLCHPRSFDGGQPLRHHPTRDPRISY